MDYSSWNNLVFLISHTTSFELPLVLIATAAGALQLARVLGRHNARAREARLARRVAACYGGLLAALLAFKFIFT